MAFALSRSTRRAVLQAAIWCVWLPWLLSLCGTANYAAEGFRIETKIFVGDEKEASRASETTTTLFSDGVVYDFLQKPEQTAVFRKADAAASPVDSSCSIQTAPRHGPRSRPSNLPAR